MSSAKRTRKCRYKKLNKFDTKNLILLKLVKKQTLVNKRIKINQQISHYEIQIEELEVHLNELKQI